MINKWRSCGAGHREITATAAQGEPGAPVLQVRDGQQEDAARRAVRGGQERQEGVAAIFRHVSFLV